MKIKVVIMGGTVPLSPIFLHDKNRDNFTVTQLTSQGLYTFRPNGIWFVVGCMATGTWIIGDISQQHFTLGNSATYAVVCVNVRTFKGKIHIARIISRILIRMCP